MHRIYESVIERHLTKYDQMIFLTGPRQVGKTTSVKSIKPDYPHLYLNWDNFDDRKIIISGYQEILKLIH